MNLLEFADIERVRAQSVLDCVIALEDHIRLTQRRSESVLMAEGPLTPKILKYLQNERNTWSEGLSIPRKDNTYHKARLDKLNELIKNIKED